jgi:regulator of sigma E protease
MAISILYSIVSVVIVLGIMIVVHEFGHFAAAKYFGVRVEVFSVGFGKRLLGFTRGETDYRISALPFGGYVKMSGENPMESRTGDPGEFMSHPRWQRFIIAVAGPFMNIVLAVGLLTGVFMVHHEVLTFLHEPAVIGYVRPNSPAERSGFKPNDRIIRAESVENPTWEDVFTRVLLSPNHPLEIVVQRGNETLTKSITPEQRGGEGPGDTGLAPAYKLVVSQLVPGMPAEKAGIKPGDEINAVDNVPVLSTDGLKSYFKSVQGHEVTISGLRNGSPFSAKLTPVWDTQDNEFHAGFVQNPYKIEKLPFGRAFSESVASNRKLSGLILELVKKMVERKVSIQAMDGPISIAKYSGEAARQEGWTPILQLMAGISLNLGIFNLLPIPILDGGLILLLFIEGLMRRDISQPVKERIYQVAFVCLVLFAGVVIFNDVVKLLPGHHVQ